MKKIFVVGTAIYYADWIENYELVNDLSKADIVLFTGGEDVSPEFYGEEDPKDVCFCNYERDEEEAKIFEKVRPDQICLGICRGLELQAHVKHGELLGRLRWLSAAKL